MEARKIADILGKKEMRDILRISARDSTSFDAEPIANRDLLTNNEGNVKTKPLKDQVLNKTKDKKKLVHDRFHPSLYIHQRKKIPIIAKACSNLADLYFNPTCKHFGKIFFNDEKINKNKSYRKRRSEIREAITHRFVQVLIHNLHIGTMVVGMPIREEDRIKSIHQQFHFYSIKKLAQKADISEDRAYKIINILKDYHYVDITEHKTKDVSGNYISLPPAITVREGLLLDLGVEPQEINTEKLKNQRILDLMNAHKKKIEYFHRERARISQVKNHMKTMRKTLQKSLEKTKVEVSKPLQNSKHNDPNFWSNFGNMNGRLQEFNAGDAKIRFEQTQESFQDSFHSENEKLLSQGVKSLQGERNDGTQEESGFGLFDTGRVEIARHVSEDAPRLQLGDWQDREPRGDFIDEARLEKERKDKEHEANKDKIKEILDRIKKEHNLIE
jgi:hypothetical protein